MYLVIELSNKKVKVTLVDEKTGSVKGYVANSLPDGAVQNGYIINPETVETSLGGIISSLPKAKGVVFLLDSSEIFQRDITAPAIAPAKVKPIIENSMLSMIGTGKDYSVDYIINGTFQDGEQSLYNVTAYAVPVSLVQSYMTIASKLKIKVLSIDVPHSAINKALSGAAVNGAPIPESSLLVKLGYSHIDMYLLENGVCTCTRTVEIETEEYLRMIHQIDPNAGFETISINPAYRAQFAAVQDLLEPMENAIVDEIYRMQQFAYSRSESKPITDVFVYGPIAAINGMVEFLDKSLDLHVQGISSISTLNLAEGIYPSDVLIPMGASKINGINLSKVAAGVGSGSNSSDIGDVLKLHLPITGVLVVLVLGVTLFFFTQANSSQSKINDIDNYLNNQDYRSKLATYDKLSVSSKDYADNKQFLEDFVKKFNKENVFTKDMMHNILNCAPPDVEFAQLDYASGELYISGLADDELSAAKYVQKLRDIDGIYYAIYSGTKLEESESSSDHYSFTILVGLWDQEPETTTAATTVAPTTEATTEGE